ncbi:T9SS type A sorting domain-containing protein [Portibacter lacus]|uniref:Gliding motility-associated C-terminal domain-containing protein n=1 Tax=Portibacter lacus TaxID=1099794 RepID=A0AA37SMN5_9BACT|nr:T9SS type A sorting domain-containing protein [Portibacter lacus]GLR16099.1 hypothetical protein GCM10007940_07140 [Portibacter lacus]
MTSYNTSHFNSKFNNPLRCFKFILLLFITSNVIGQNSGPNSESAFWHPENFAISNDIHSEVNSYTTCPNSFSGTFENDCGTDRSLKTYMKGYSSSNHNSGDYTINIPSSPYATTRVIVEVWIETNDCNGNNPANNITFDFGGLDNICVKGVLAVQSSASGVSEYFYRYIYTGSPTYVNIIDVNGCDPTSMVVVVERDEPNATSSLTTFDQELHGQSAPECITDIILLGQNDVDRNITIAVPIHEKDEVRKVTVEVEIKTSGSNTVLATHSQVFNTATGAQGNGEAALYEITLEDVPGGGDIAEVTVCSPYPNGDSFGVGSITATTNEICVTCLLTGEMTDDEICKGEEASISADYTSTSYEGNNDNGNQLEVSYLWETGETTSTINVSPTETTTYSCTITDELNCKTVETATVTVNEIIIDNFDDEYLCEDEGKQTSFGGATPLGGVYSGTGVEDNGDGATYTFNPATAGPGVHEVTYTYTDDNECSNSATIEVTVYPGLSIQTNGFCNEESEINIGISITGGSGDFQYEWEGPNGFESTNSDLFNVEPGTYYVTVTDKYGCYETANETQIACCLPPTIDCPSDVTIQCDDSDDPSFTGEPTTGEGCGEITVTYEDSDEAGECDNERIITRTWKAKDADNNYITCEQIITIVDTEGPEFETPPADITISCLSDLPEAEELNWTDNCDGEGSVLGEDESDGETCPETITRTWSYTDACGNPGSVSQTITIHDQTKPEITSNFDDDELGCNPTVVPPTFSVSDNCLDITMEPTVNTDGPQNTGCAYTQKWTATYIDACGNEADEVSITYTWTEDSEKPVINTEAEDKDLGCNPTIVEPVFTVSDNCLLKNMTLTPETDGPTNQGCYYTQTWTANYTDGCDNIADEESVTYTWKIDTEKPVISTDAEDKDLGCNPTIVPPTFMVEDNCLDVTMDAEVTYEGPTAEGCVLTKSWTATYTDECGNEAVPVTVSYTWTVDTEKPVISTDAEDKDLGCNPTVVPPTFTVTDNCMDETLDVTPVTDGPTSLGCYYTQTWTANYTDACGNIAVQESVTYNWSEDTEKPVISSDSQSKNLGCNPEFDAPIFYVNDNCLDIADMTISAVTDGPQSNGCAMTQTWTANYKDHCNNEADEASVTYTWISDAQEPVISTDAEDKDLGCNPTVVPPTFTATDNCLDATVNVVPETDGPTKDGCYYTQTWTANYGTSCDTPAEPKSVTYTWKIDTEKPVISTDAVTKNLGCNPTVVPPTFKVEDNCLDITVEAEIFVAEPIATGCVMTKSWTATYTDECGNEAVPVTVSYTWTVDTEKPVIETDAEDKDLGCNPTVVPPTFTVTDNCMDETLNLTPVTDGPTSLGCYYTQTWTANYTDACGNIAAQESVTYTWSQDTEKPVISSDSQSKNLGCNPEFDAPIFYVNDNCLDIADMTISAVTDGPQSNGCAMTQTWTANYKDHCNNEADEASVTYTWISDAQEPVISTDAEDKDLGCNPTVVPPTFTAFDKCLDATVNVVPETDGPTKDGCYYTQTWTANYGTSCDTPAEPKSVTYTWKIDTEKPVILTDAVTKNLGCNPTVVPPTFTVEDNCLDITVDAEIFVAEPIATGCVMTKSWTATYTDECGNEAVPVTVSYTWTVDTEKPVIETDAEDKDLGCNPTVVPPTFTVTDNCMDETLNVTPVTDGPTSLGCYYTQTWTANYTDACGNIAVQESVTYTWSEDTEKPVISSDSQSKNLGCNPEFDAPIFYVNDNCLDIADMTISAVTDGPQSNGCAMTQTWTANYKDHCNNEADEASVTYTWISDAQEPVISTDAEDKDLGCNPTVVPPTFTAFDKCLDATVNVVPETDGPTNDGCYYTQTWTANYGTSCDTPAEPKSVTYTWKIDTEKPVISTDAVTKNLGCNPTVVPPTFKVEDNCLDITVDAEIFVAEPIATGCVMTKSWTATYTDECGNEAVPVTISYTWTVDTEKPVIETDAEDKDLGCNPTVVPPTFTVTDNCMDETLDVTPVTDGPTSLGCYYTQTWTANYTDACGNIAVQESVTYNWSEDTEKPVIYSDSEDKDLGCNPEFDAPIFYVNDNCLDIADMTISAVTDGPQSDGCKWTQTWTANYSDYCQNAADQVSVTYTWSEDTEKPVISSDSEDKDLGCNPTVVPPTFTVTDNCMDETLNVTPVTDGPTSLGCYYTQTWTADYTDACGNIAEQESVTYTWSEDTEKPVISSDSEDKDLGCNPEFDAPIFYVNDNCLDIADMTISAVTDGPQSNGCAITQTWTANYSDNCQNVADQVSVTYTWSEDTEKPVISSDSEDKDLGCNPEIIPPTFSATDNCKELRIDIAPTTTGPSNQGCYYTQTWTADYTDACGNIAEQESVTYTWISASENPEITTDAESQDLGCNPEVIAPTFEVIDNCIESGNDVIITTEGQVNEGCHYSQTWTANYEGICGSAEEKSITYTWTIDTEDPVITFINPMMEGLQNGDIMKIQCYGQNPNWQIPEASINDVSVSDNCDAEVEVNVTEVKIGDGDCAQDGYIQRLRCSWTATDACGNSTLLYIFMDIVDEIPPVFTSIPLDATVTCDNIPDAPTMTAVDECLCADVTFEEEFIASECVRDQMIKRTWTATDCCGNEATTTQTIFFTDDTAPTLTIALPGDLDITEDLTLTFDCNSGGIPSEYDALSLENATSTEMCSGIPVITLDENISLYDNCNNGALEVQTYTWTTSDACGNTKSITLTIRVVDTVAPVIVGSSEYVCGSDDDIPFVYSLDACGNSNMSFFDREVDGACGNVVERVYEAVDRCGNYATFVQTIIFDDVTSPEISINAEALVGIANGDTVSVSCGENFLSIGLDDAVFTDECDRPLETSFEEIEQGSMNCDEGGKSLMKLVWKAEDFCGNVSEYAVYVRTIDTEAPVFENFRSELTVSCDRSIPDTEAIDNCGSATVQYEDEIIPGDCPNTYDVKRRILASDECGNTSERTQLIHVVDQQGPQILGLEEFICEDISMPEVSAVDNCGNADIEVFMVQDTVFSEECDAQYYIRRMWSATDLCGNTTEVEQMISIQDVTAPELIYNEELKKYMGNSATVYMSNPSDMQFIDEIDWYTVLGRDNCVGAIINPEFTENSIKSEQCAEDGWYEKRSYTWEVSDACGNKSRMEINLIIIDDIPPVLVNQPQSANFGCNPIPDLGNLEPPTFGSLVDSMSGSITFTEIEDMTDDIMTITNTWYAQDECGNVSQAVQTLASIVNSDLATTIETEENIRCNSHQNIVTADVTGGQAPFTYEWTIQGKDCQIQGGQGTETIEIYVGFHTVNLTLQVTDANNCITFSEKIIECLTKGELDGEIETLAIEEITPNPSVESFELNVYSAFDQNINYQIVNPLGQLVKNQNADVIKGLNSLMIDVNDFPGGTYYIKVTDGESTDLKKFMKIK